MAECYPESQNEPKCVEDGIMIPFPDGESSGLLIIIHAKVAETLPSMQVSFVPGVCHFTLWPSWHPCSKDR